jgi:predicted secreted hydrolase
MRYIVLLVLLLVVGLLLANPVQNEIEASFQLTLVQESFSPSFATADEPKAFNFPRDHGPHTEFQTEWWYYTGNLQTVSGEKFGYQLTIFRRALSDQIEKRSAGLATEQIYFAHFAIADAKGVHASHERFSRGAGGLAGATANPYKVWLEDWQVTSLDESASMVRVRAQHIGNGFDLELHAIKPVIPHGDGGLSAKSSESGNASYYLSFPRMETEGSLTISGKQHSVSGLSWFDHEWGSSALSAQAVGWDWFGLQLEDGTDLMLFQIRNEDGSYDRVSGGTLINVSGESTKLEQSDINILTTGEWTSGATGATYPSGWRIDVPLYDIDIAVTPLITNQEMNLSIVYWEGAVQISGTIAGKSVSGTGYVELTGYSASMQGMF